MVFYVANTKQELASKENQYFEDEHFVGVNKTTVLHDLFFLVLSALGLFLTSALLQYMFFIVSVTWLVLLFSGQIGVFVTLILRC